MTKSELKSIINECLDERFLLEKMDIDDGSKGDTLYKPVFIVLLYSDSDFDHKAEKFVKNQEFWHASIGFGASLSKTYSFNYDECEANKYKGGLSYESFSFYKSEHPTGTMEVSCIFVSKAKYDQLRTVLDYYIENKEKTKYSFINLAYSLFGRAKKNGMKFNLVCSTFVDTILKSVNVKLNDKQTNLVKPDDLKYNDSKEKQFKLFKGKIVDYKPEEAHKMVEKLANKESSNYFGR